MENLEALQLLKTRGVEIDLGDHRSPLEIAQALGFIQMQDVVLVQAVQTEV